MNTKRFTIVWYGPMLGYPPTCYKYSGELISFEEAEKLVEEERKRVYTGKNSYSAIYDVETNMVYNDYFNEWRDAGQVRYVEPNPNNVAFGYES